MSSLISNFYFYDSFRHEIARSINLSLDTFKILLTTASYTPDPTSHKQLSDISNEVLGYGYERQTLVGVKFELIENRSVFSFSDVTFLAEGGFWSARHYVIYDDSVSEPLRPLIGYGDLSEDRKDVVVTDGNILLLKVGDGGLFEIK